MEGIPGAIKKTALSRQKSIHIRFIHGFQTLILVKTQRYDG
jgi:hypothetical protein